MNQSLPTYKIVIPYRESANLSKEFKIEYTVEAADRETALRKAEREFMEYTQYSSASWVRIIDRNNVRAWKILPNSPQTSQAIDEMAKNLESLDPDTLYNVLKAIGDLEDATFSGKILPLLHHQNPDLAAMAVETIGKVGDASCVPSLLKRFDQQATPRIKASILSSLSRIATSRDSIEEVVATALGDGDSRVRANAVELVERLKLSGIARNLVPMLTDEDNRVRANVLKALWHTHNRTLLTNTLKEMIESPNRWMKISAAFVLQHIDLNERIEYLKKLLQDTESEVQVAGTKTLLSLQELALIPLWLDVLATSANHFEAINTKILNLGIPAFEPVIAYHPHHPEHRLLIRKILDNLISRVYRDKGFFDWLKLKSSHFFTLLKKR